MVDKLNNDHCGGLKKEILIIEDEEQVAELLSIFFSSAGWSSRICLDAESVMTALEDCRYDAVFTDFFIPGMKGDRIYGMIKQRHPELLDRFVLMTGAMLDDEIDSFIEDKGIRVVRKPFKIEDIYNILKEFQER